MKGPWGVVMGGSVLVVEDSAAMRGYVGDTLRSEGYRVIEAKDGVEALERIADSDIRLVVTDLRMPNLDGFELIRRIRDKPEHGGLPIVVLTCDGGPDCLERVRSAGADEALKKPFRRRDLLEAVHDLLAGESRPAATGWSNGT